MRCPKCKHESPEGTARCAECGYHFTGAGQSYDELVFELDQRFLRGEIPVEEYNFRKQQLDDTFKDELVDDGDDLDLSGGFSFDDPESDLPSGYEELDDAEHIAVAEAPPPPLAAEDFSPPDDLVEEAEEKPAVPAPPPPPPDPKVPVVATSRVLAGHKDSIWALAFSPDGKYIVSGGEGATLKLWSVKSGKMARSLPAGERGFTSVAVTPDGKNAITGDRAQMIMSWDLLMGKKRQIGDHGHWVASLDISPDGCMVLTGAGDGQALEWEADSYRDEPRVYQSGKGGISAVAYSRDGKHVFVGGDDNRVRVYGAGGGELVSSIKGHTGKITSIACSHQSDFVLTGSEDMSLRTWKSPMGAPINEFRGHTAPVLSVACSADGEYALSGSGDLSGNLVADNTVRLWDLETGEPVMVFAGHEAPVTAVAFSPDGKVGASASLDKTVRIWKLP